MGLIFLVVGPAAAFLLTLFVSAIHVTLFSSLRHVPGPLWAKFTRLWYLRRVHLGKFERDNIELHRRYGRVVRVGPNMYSLDMPECVKAVYGLGSNMPKSDWYDAWKPPAPDLWGLFSDRNMKRHAESRRQFQALYSMSSLLNYEVYVDECTDIFINRLSEFAKRHVAIDMNHWLTCCAFDVIGNITYSQRFGFLDKGHDISGILSALDHAIYYSTIVGIYPALHKCVFGLMARLGLGGAGGRNALMTIINERIDQRSIGRSPGNQTSASTHADAPQDFLEKLMAKKENDEQAVTRHHLFVMGLENTFGGAETIATTMSAMLYHLSRSPEVMEKLRHEVDSKTAGAKVSFEETQQMPYLQAVIKETQRIHSATGLPLWREVTAGGLELGGYSFPPGSIVGLNTWVAHFNEDVYGPDADQFRPERWVENEDESQLKAMNAYFLPFGLGTRTCLGRHIAKLEMSKILAMLVRNFDISPIQGQREWTLKNRFLVSPTGFMVNVRDRSTA